MAEELQEVQLREDFYRDSFGKIIFIIVSIIIAIASLVSTAVYLHLNKPQPVSFLLNPEWRVQLPVPVEQPYISQADMLQWVTNAIRNSFNLDFYHYNDQLKKTTGYFTPEGWRVFLNQLNIYANYNTVQTSKSFINAVPAGAPFVLQQGILSGRYAWWVQMPITIYYVNYDRNFQRSITLQILVVRVSTLNNLDGIGIDRVIVSSGATNTDTTTEGKQTGTRTRTR